MKGYTRAELLAILDALQAASEAAVAHTFALRCLADHITDGADVPGFPSGLEGRELALGMAKLHETRAVQWTELGESLEASFAASGWKIPPPPLS